MANIQEVTITLGATIPTGQYANITPEITVRALLTPEDDWNEVTDRLTDEIKAHLSFLAAKVARKRMDMNIPLDDIIAWIHAVTDVENES